MQSSAGLPHEQAGHANQLDVPESSVSNESGGKEKFDVGLALRYSVANFGAQAVFALLTTGFPLYLNTYPELSQHPEIIGLLSNERALVAAVAQPIVGRLSDRTRSRLGKRRPFFLVGVPLMSLALVLLGTHPDLWIMLGIVTIAAFFLWVALDPYNALMADLFRPSHRGRVGGILGLAQMLDAIAFFIIALYLWRAENILLVFSLTTVILVISFAITFFTVKEPPLEDVVEAPSTRVARGNPITYITGLLRYREAAKYTGALALFWIGNGGATPFVTLFGKEALRLEDSTVFYLPLAFVVSTALFAVPAGLLADRIGKKAVLTAGLIIFGAGAIIGSQSADLTQGIIALTVIGIGNAGLGTMIIPLLTDLIPRGRTAELVGLSSAITSFVQPVGSVLAGEVVSLATPIVGPNDAYRWSFIFAGTMILLGALAMRSLHPERPLPEEHQSEFAQPAHAGVQ